MPRLSSTICLFIAAALAGCAQSPSALDLANKTNAAALSVKTQVESFATTQRRVSEIETARLARFLEVTVDTETAVDEVIGQSPSKQAALYRSVRTEAKDILTAEANPAKEAAALRQELLKKLEEFAPPGERIDALSADLTVLGEEKSFRENIAFFISYGTSVKEAIDKAKAERDKALKSAGTK